MCCAVAGAQTPSDTPTEYAPAAGTTAVSFGADPDFVDHLRQWAAFATRGALTVIDQSSNSPIIHRTYQFRARGTPLASLTLTFAGDAEQVSRVGILGRPAFEGLGERLADCLVDVGNDERPDPNLILGMQMDARTVVVRVEDGADQWDMYVDGAESSATIVCVDAILNEVHREIGPIDPGWPFAEAAGWGLFQTATDVPALVWVDGWPTGRRTPLRAFPLQAGTHVVEWYDPVEDRMRVETVRIEGGVTTQMDVTVP
jgi:hypothetical protein